MMSTTASRFLGPVSSRLSGSDFDLGFRGYGSAWNSDRPRLPVLDLRLRSGPGVRRGLDLDLGCYSILRHCCRRHC